MKCNKCGKEMEYADAQICLCLYCGNFIRWSDSSSTPQTQFNSSSTQQTQFNETQNLKPIGWICPVCGRGVSPFESSCPCYIKPINVASTTDTAPKLSDYSKILAGTETPEAIFTKGE